jgi:3-hydroxybutyryl-CoA dehydrogenase
MGSGIALSAAEHGIPVVLYDLDPGKLTRASESMQKELRQQVDKKRIRPEEKQAILARIRFAGSLSACRAPVILEAIIENAEAKAALFRELEKWNDSQTLFASNTSSLSLTGLAERTGCPERVVGMHFFNPAARMKLVEIVKTKYSPEEAIQRVRRLAIRMGKVPVVCRDTPGFIVNRVARPFYLEALRLAENGVADMETIDRLVENAGFRMGPFHLMDLIGNDINYTVSCSLYEALGKPVRLKPSSLQESKVKQGHLGRKTGRGFFKY